MLNRLLFLFLILGPASAFAEDPDHLMRVSWVKTLKVFLGQLEKKEAKNLQLTVEEKRFLEKFSLIEKAWADPRHDCFYGGWPSSTVTSGGQRVCQSPKARDDFFNSPCAANQIRCQPSLFGPSLCAPFRSDQDKRSVFANCEGMFQGNGGSYDFLKDLGPQAFEDLRELSAVAGDICRTQKNSPMCAEVLRKIDAGIRSIDRGWRGTVPEAERSEAPPPAEPTTTIRARSEDCDENVLPEEMRQLDAITARNLEQMYETVRQKFERSPFCDPMKVLSDPAERPNPLLLRELTRDMSSFEMLPFQSRVSEDPRVNNLLRKYHLGTETAAKVRPLMERVSGSALNSEARKRALLELRMTILQDFARNRNAQSALSGLVTSSLASSHIFRRERNGEITCPFVTKDAFMKAMRGRNNVYSAYGRQLPNRDLLTIVDYTRPSNERRLFVIDLANLEVAHNTWVAHGSGNVIGKNISHGPGSDGLGSNPPMSNVNGSNLSSDGFIIAGERSHGATFGPNVILRGVDRNNGNLAARSVIVHGWASPMDDYSNGVSLYNPAKNTYGPTRDPVRGLLSANPSTDSTASLENTMDDLRSSTWLPQYLQPTYGCLGVPRTKAGHLDRRGRSRTQLELLREDLPGSLIFNYSGPSMTSRYFQ